MTPSTNRPRKTLLLAAAIGTAVGWPLPVDAKRENVDKLLAAHHVNPRVAEFFGKEAVATVAASTSIEIARLRKDPMGEAIKIDRVDRVGGDLGRAFRGLLLHHGTYDLPAVGESDAKLCGGFEPAAAVRFTRAGKPPVDIILSIKCVEGGFAAGPDLPKKLTKGATYAGWPKFRADMAPGQTRVLMLLVKAFPSDADLRAYLAAQQGN
jgi:hypothetical protein